MDEPLSCEVALKQLKVLTDIAGSLKGINESLHALTEKSISCTANGYTMTMVERHLGELAGVMKADQETKKRKSG